MCSVSGCNEEAVYMSICRDGDCPDADVPTACQSHVWMMCKPVSING